MLVTMTAWQLVKNVHPEHANCSHECQTICGDAPKGVFPYLLNMERLGMYYCFLAEDIIGLKDDPLIIQKNYAQKLGKLCIADLTQNKITDDKMRPIDLNDQKGFFRCTCDNMMAGIYFLQERGVKLVETEMDVMKIERWYNKISTCREFLEFTLSDMEKGLCNDQLGKNLVKGNDIFLKSVRKGFTAVINPVRIIKHDLEVTTFLKKQWEKYGEHLLLTCYQKVKTDSLGTRESRHIVMNGNVINSSRFVPYLRHIVPRSHIIKAHEIAENIRRIRNFPQNYVLDLGEFIDDSNNMYLDIVELNPLTCSMCYVNNSIFDYVLPEIKKIQDQSRMGAEYCYDAVERPQKYHARRISNKDYSYLVSDRYYFL